MRIFSMILFLSLLVLTVYSTIALSIASKKTQAEVLGEKSVVTPTPTPVTY